ncbi:hypothetical protein [Aestuariispira insulae]|uniref:Uncharacterized protein n=1 Tax=Aestuariispira insulae TaxID=1461337 RepID=A0A3D9HIL8_9PROT|nr:hypothetical protein [Aestuariispira insulae]RED49111.1 hypothetical protein DFP90_10688 [Aestuariispira insulae]
MYELRFTVWQFVRLMVQLEKSIENVKTGPLRTLYDGWEDIWVDLDARLVDLGKHDPEAFAELMMDQEVVCNDVSKDDSALVAEQLALAVNEIKGLLKETDDQETVEDLSFERDELQELAKDIKKQAGLK